MAIKICHSSVPNFEKSGSSAETVRGHMDPLSELLPGYGVEFKTYSEFIREWEDEERLDGPDRKAGQDPLYKDVFDSSPDKEVYAKREAQIPDMVRTLLQQCSLDMKKHIVLPAARLEWYQTLHGKLMTWIEKTFTRVYTRKTIGTMYITLSLSGAVARLLIVVHKLCHRKRIAMLAKPETSNPIDDFFLACEKLYDESVVIGNGAPRPDSVESLLQTWHDKITNLLDEAVRATNDLVSARKIQQERQREKEYLERAKRQALEYKRTMDLQQKQLTDLVQGFAQKETGRKRSGSESGSDSGSGSDSDAGRRRDLADEGASDSDHDAIVRAAVKQHKTDRGASDSDDSGGSDGGSSDNSGSDQDSDGDEKMARPRRKRAKALTDEQKRQNEQTLKRFGDAYERHKTKQSKARNSIATLMDTSHEMQEFKTSKQKETREQQVKKDLQETTDKHRDLVEHIEILEKTASVAEPRDEKDGIELDAMLRKAEVEETNVGIRLDELETMARDEDKTDMLGQGTMKAEAQAELEASKAMPTYSFASLDKDDEETKKITAQVDETSNDIYEAAARFVWWVGMQLAIVRSRTVHLQESKETKRRQKRKKLGRKLLDELQLSLFRDDRPIQPAHELTKSVERMVYAVHMPCGTRLRYMQLKTKALRDSLEVVIMNIALSKARAVKVSEMATALDLPSIFKSADTPLKHSFFELLVLILFKDYMEIHEKMDDFHQKYIVDTDNLSVDKTYIEMFREKREGDLQPQRPKMVCLLSRWWIIGTQSLHYCSNVTDMISEWCYQILYDFDGTMEDGFAIRKILVALFGADEVAAAKKRRESMAGDFMRLFGLGDEPF